MCIDEFDGFEWDEAKNDWNVRVRNLDFEDAARIFGNETACVTSRSLQQHDEERYLTLGAMDGDLLLVIWTPRGRIRRIISARRASRKERNGYRQAGNT